MRRITSLFVLIILLNGCAIYSIVDYPPPRPQTESEKRIDEFQKFVCNDRQPELEIDDYIKCLEDARKFYEKNHVYN